MYKVKHQYFPKGSTIIRPGDPSDKLYIISEGEVDIFLKSFDKEFIL